MRIAIATNFSGLLLSKEARQDLIDRGVEVRTTCDPTDRSLYMLKPDIPVNLEFNRHDSRLLATIEKLGDKAGYCMVKIEIIEIPAVDYVIIPQWDGEEVYEKGWKLR